MKTNLLIKMIFYFQFLNIISCTIDNTKPQTEKENMYGKIIEKYRDEKNHMVPTIIYINSEGEFKYQLDDWALGSDLWDYLQTNDSIYKPTGTLVLKIVKPNGDYKEYDYRR